MSICIRSAPLHRNPSFPSDTWWSVLSSNFVLTLPVAVCAVLGFCFRLLPFLELHFHYDCCHDCSDTARPTRRSVIPPWTRRSYSYYNELSCLSASSRRSRPSLTSCIVFVLNISSMRLLHGSYCILCNMAHTHTARCFCAWLGAITGVGPNWSVSTGTSTSGLTVVLHSYSLSEGGRLTRPHSSHVLWQSSKCPRFLLTFLAATDISYSRTAPRTPSVFVLLCHGLKYVSHLVTFSQFTVRCRSLRFVHQRLVVSTENLQMVGRWFTTKIIADECWHDGLLLDVALQDVLQHSTAFVHTCVDCLVYNCFPASHVVLTVQTALSCRSESDPCLSVRIRTKSHALHGANRFVHCLLSFEWNSNLRSQDSECTKSCAASHPSRFFESDLNGSLSPEYLGVACTLPAPNQRFPLASTMLPPYSRVCNNVHIFKRFVFDDIFDINVVFHVNSDFEELSSKSCELPRRSFCDTRWRPPTKPPPIALQALSALSAFSFPKARRWSSGIICHCFYAVCPVQLPFCWYVCETTDVKR